MLQVYGHDFSFKQCKIACLQPIVRCSQIKQLSDRSNEWEQISRRFTRQADGAEPATEHLQSQVQRPSDYLVASGQKSDKASHAGDFDFL